MSSNLNPNLKNESLDYLDLKLQHLLQLHDQSSAQTSGNKLASMKTIPMVFGDGFLFLNNPLFKRIRTQFLESGYTFTADDFCHYDVLPYASLPHILEKKKVPYKDNVTVFRQIENQRPGHFSIGDIPKIKSNYLLHESSHCLAESLIKKQKLQLDNSKLTKEQKIIFPFILAESFANTVESLANAFNKTPEAQLFYDLNSYVTHSKKVHAILRRCLETFGEKTTFTLIYVSYVCANLLLPEPSTKQLQQLLTAGGISETVAAKLLESPQARKLFLHGYELNLDFRLQTTSFFCQTLGIDTPLEKLFKIDLVEVLKKTNCVENFISHTQFLFKD